jgi:hypothetical protein
VFVDLEGRAVNIKIALVAKEPGAAARLIRALAAKQPAEHRGTLAEPEPGSVRLLGLDWFQRESVLDTGEIAHPHVYAIEATADRPPTDYEWLSVLHGADAVIEVLPRDPHLADHVARRGAIPIVRIDASKLDATLEGLIEVSMLDAGAERALAAEQEAQVFAGVQCPWCFESMEIAVEADVEGSYVQDCEVCCRPWAVTVRRDADGDVIVDVGRA